MVSRRNAWYVIGVGVGINVGVYVSLCDNNGLNQAVSVAGVSITMA